MKYWKLFVEDEVSHAGHPGALVAAVGGHPALPPTDLEAVERRGVVDPLEVGCVRLREAREERRSAETTHNREEVVLAAAGRRGGVVVEQAEVGELQAVARADLHGGREAEARLIIEIEIVRSEYDRPGDAARRERNSTARVVALEHHEVQGEVEPADRGAAAVGIGSDQTEHVAEEAVAQPVMAHLSAHAVAKVAAIAVAVGTAVTHSAAHSAAHWSAHLSAHGAHSGIDAHVGGHRTVAAVGVGRSHWHGSGHSARPMPHCSGACSGRHCSGRHGRSGAAHVGHWHDAGHHAHLRLHHAGWIHGRGHHGPRLAHHGLAISLSLRGGHPCRIRHHRSLRRVKLRRSRRSDSQRRQRRQHGQRPRPSHVHRSISAAQKVACLAAKVPASGAGASTPAAGSQRSARRNGVPTAAHFRSTGAIGAS